MKPISLAIVGCGAITESGHLPAALRSPDVEVSALVDTRLPNAQALARRFGLSCAVSDRLESVLDRVEGILIATPNHAHRAVAELALRRRLPVLIEKPLATTYEDAASLCRLSDEVGAFIAVGYRSRFWPAVRALKHLLETNFFGRPRSFRYSFGTSAGWATVSGFNLDRRMAGGGALIDAHVVDKILYWFGEPTEFTYSDDSYGGVESTCEATMAFGDAGEGLRGRLMLSRTRDLPNMIVIETDKYLCELAESPAAPVKLRGRERPDVQLTVDSITGQPGEHRDDFQAQLEEFARNIRGRGEITVDGHFGARSIRLIEAMYRSRRQLPEPWIHAASEMERVNAR